MLGFAFCGSFCSFRDCLVQFDALIDRGYDVIPIMSENAYSTDTRFYAASDFVKRVEEKAGRKTVHTIAEAEKLGFKQIIIPKHNMQGLDATRFGIEICPVRKVEEAFRILFG